MLATRPSGTRCIGYNRRGYSGSCSNTDKILQSPTGQRDIIGEDLIAFLRYIVDNVSILNRESNKLALVGWSAGCQVIISAYSHLSSLHPRDKELLTAKINRIIFFEPPGTSSFLLPPVAANHFWWEQCLQKMASPEAANDPSLVQEAFWAYATGFYDLDPLIINDGLIILDDRVKAARFSALSEDLEFKKAYLEDALDSGPVSFDMSGKWHTDPALAQLRIQMALEALIGSDGIEEILVLTTKHAVPDCIAGAQWLSTELGKLGSRKTRLVIAEGRYNHWFPNTNPDLFWQLVQGIN